MTLTVLVLSLWMLSLTCDKVAAIFSVSPTVEVFIFAGNLFSLYSRGHGKREIKLSLIFMLKRIPKLCALICEIGGCKG